MPTATPSDATNPQTQPYQYKVAFKWVAKSEKRVISLSAQDSKGQWQEIVEYLASLKILKFKLTFDDNGHVCECDSPRTLSEAWTTTDNRRRVTLNVAAASPTSSPSQPASSSEWTSSAPVMASQALAHGWQVLDALRCQLFWKYLSGSRFI